VRLGTLLLTAAVAASAQTPPRELPWTAARSLPWIQGPTAPAEAVPPAPAPTELTLTVTLAEDGALRITDDKGTITLRMGLPGRPMKFWRDGGTPLPPASRMLRFPTHTPLQLGIGGLHLGSEDFRPALAGLLWILDDDERVITVIHPATARVAYLPLPGGHGISLVFHPDRLEAQKILPGPPERIEDVSWSLPWLALLPQFIQLGQAKPRPLKEGTALVPFPRE
jgi:hypothetical protein